MTDTPTTSSRRTSLRACRSFFLTAASHHDTLPVAHAAGADGIEAARVLAIATK